MCIPRTSALVIAGPDERPDGSREATERHADRLALALRWHDAKDAAECASLLDAVAAEAVVLASGSLDDSTMVAEAAANARRRGATVVHVDTAVRQHPAPVPEACDLVIHGRQRRSLRAALDWLDAEHRHPALTVPYGTAPDQVGDLRVPDRGGERQGLAPVAALLHGGFWLDPWGRDQMAQLAVALTGQGWATWNLGYRRLGPSEGGWPATLEDVCAGFDQLADLAPPHGLDLEQVTVIGHSVGAQLGIYATTRHRQRGHAPGVVPRVRASAMVSLAGVLDLKAAADAGLGNDAVTSFLGDPADQPERYELVSPRQRLPLGIPMLAVHGSDDRLVPVSQTTDFVARARDAGDQVTLARPDVSHLDIIDPAGPSGPLVGGWMSDRRR